MSTKPTKNTFLQNLLKNFAKRKLVKKVGKQSTVKLVSGYKNLGKARAKA